MSSVLLWATALATTAAALNNGVGKLPALGYDTFNAFGCDYNASSVLAQARIMRDVGLVEAGYNILILDDCYALKQRNASGHMVADPEKFPDGLPAFSAQVERLGISLAAYGNNGYETCAGYPGSYGRELQDLQTWHSWGMKYLKYDNCYIPADNITQQNMLGRYTRMSDAIAKFATQTGCTFEFSLCEWGWEQPWIWGKRLAQAWRIDGDIKPFWSAISAIIDQVSFQYWATDFYGHNDMDILEVGNTGVGTPPGNLTYEESKSHFTAWALMKSPLIIGTDLTEASTQTLNILRNQNLIKINQDPNVGEGISPFSWGVNPDYVSNPAHPAEYWSGNSSYGVVIMVLNSQDQPATMSFNLTQSWALRAGRQYSVYDMWTQEQTGVAVRNMTFELPPHGVRALLLNDAGPEPASLDGSCGLYYQCSWPNGTYISN
ncbi:glycoside hydrolase family 27 protein [Dothistroma septosporum NZE10]|uniref:Alpha-galactosidase n=1 Tax=Dothistroma septosporum (strain NZE10 / CBS 128990) TaxID=675120 RepID=N1PD97_DOTSN|nr:glycoside hydrolase family 27 protein [Dothistroma septosporum NZE10]